MFTRAVLVRTEKVILKRKRETLLTDGADEETKETSESGKVSTSHGGDEKNGKHPVALPKDFGMDSRQKGGSDGCKEETSKNK